jgi:hypothetical protein
MLDNAGVGANESKIGYVWEGRIVAFESKKIARVLISPLELTFHGIHTSEKNVNAAIYGNRTEAGFED